MLVFDPETGLLFGGDAANLSCEVSIDHGTPVVIADTTAVEVRTGYYRFSLSRAETNGDNVRFYGASSTSGVVVIVPGHDPQTVVLSAASTVSGSTSGGSVPFGLDQSVSYENAADVQDGANAGDILIELIIGDDYLATNGRSFDWTVAQPPGTTAAASTCTLTFRLASGCSAFSISIAGTVTDEGLGTAKLSFDITDTQSATIPVGEYFFFVTMTGDAGQVITKVFTEQLVLWRGK